MSTCTARIAAGDGWTFAHCERDAGHNGALRFHLGRRHVFHRSYEAQSAQPVEALIMWDDAPDEPPTPA